MTLETERLLLRPWEDGDAEALYKYASDPEIGPATGWEAHTSVKHSLGIIRTALSGPDTFAVVLKETGEPVGSIGLFPGETCGAGELELGYWVGRPYWGRGLIPEASLRLMTYGFEVLGCPRLWCSHFRGNGRSRRVIEKCGFRDAKIERESLWPSGRREVCHYYSISKDDWREGEA